jgi:hypothetical protein
MQPLKLTIPGTYWDSQIYAGRLYLFGLSGDLITLEWDRVSDELKIDHNLGLAFQAAFLESNLLYHGKYRILFHDPEIKNIIVSKFERLAKYDLTLSDRHMRELMLGRQDNPFPIPHTDSTIYYRNLYVSAQDGVYRATCNKKTKYPIGSRTEKKWDAHVFALSASYRSLALAAGDEGLFELALGQTGLRTLDISEPVNLAPRNFTGCNWTFHSIYGSSHIEAGCLAAFQKFSDGENAGQSFERRFDSLLLESEIFQGSGYSWGVGDKLCQARNGCVHVVRYSPWKENREDQFEQLGSLPIADWKGEVIAGAVANFGIIIECENAVIVLPSDGDPITFPGEPVNWRIFPRSKFYENHLHLIYEDRVEVLSFNHDYFVDQWSKLSGTQVFGIR